MVHLVYCDNIGKKGDKVLDKIMNNKKTGITRLSIRRGYRDKDGKVKNVTIKNLGNLEDLKKQYDDPIAHFKELVKKMQKRK